MIDTVVVSGGNIQVDFALDFLKKLKKEINRKTSEQVSSSDDKDLRLIAADKGLEFFMAAGITPDLVVGDFDSLSQEGKEYMEKPPQTSIYRLKPEKDDSDTQSAVNLAISQGARDILILGGTGTRLDHVIANLGLLLSGKERGVDIRLADVNNFITLVDNGTVLHKDRQYGKYVSFFSVGGDVTGLTLEGFKYPLHDHHLRFAESGLTVSNEIKDQEARITFSRGNLLMLMTRD
nr:thiamine diphosphokinase [uncultured Blautia sp.]